MRAIVSCALVCAAGLLLPRQAAAQWSLGVYLGANHTQSASVTIDQPSRDRTMTFEGVAFEGRPFASPQYYGWRLGRQIGRSPFGLEFEFIHLKVIGLTDRTYAVSGTVDGAATRMDALVQRYSMTHGLNFALVNLVLRTPTRGPVSLVWRAGVGPTLPHAETTIDGESREQYEYAGPGGHLSGGLEWKAWRALSATAEYKFTIARPRIDVIDGTGVTTAATHQVAFGLAFGLGR